MAKDTNGHGTMHASALKMFETAKRESKLFTSKAWGIDIELRGLTMGQRSKLLTEAYTKGADRQPIYETFYPMLLRFGCYDPTDGTAFLADATDDQINGLEAREVERVSGELLKLSGLDAEAEKTLGEDSGGTTTSTSGTSSRVPSGARSKS